jgi:uncharacterized lipoprotein YddW (UPF0748 family)
MQEVRGVWIPNIDHSACLKSKDNIDTAMANLKNWGFNTVFPVVWNKGYTLFKSSTMKELFGADIDPNLSDFTTRDPLQEVIDVAHSQGLKVIPWFEYGFCCSHREDGGHILAKKPNWGARFKGELVRKGELTWMNALDRAVQDFMQSLMLEVVTNYDVDGIQGDDHLAFPAEKLSNGISLNTATNNLTNFFRRLVKEIKKVKTKKIIFSMSPNPYPWCKEHYLQDTKAWIDEGIVDLVCPQLYRPNLEKYIIELALIKKYFSEEHLKKFAPGLAINVDNTQLPYTVLSEYIQENRKVGLGGHIYFMYESLCAESNKIGSLVQSKSHQDLATLPSFLA